MGENDLLRTRKNLIESHSGGVENCGIGSRLEGGLGAVTVAVVALPHFIDDRGFGKATLLGSLRVGGGPVRT